MAQAKDNVAQLMREGLPLDPADREKIGIAKLGMVHSARLVTFIETEYLKSGLGDAEFAEKASKALGFSVNAYHVKNRRDELGIVSGREQAHREASRTVIARVEALEADVLWLKAKLADLLK